MKILFVADKAEGGGAENQMIEEMMILKDYYNLALTTNVKPTLKTLKKLKTNNIIYLGSLAEKKIESEITNLNFTFIHGHNIWQNETIRFLKKIHLPIVLTIHDYRIVCPSGWKVQPNQVKECMDRNPKYCAKAGCFEESYSINTGASLNWFVKQEWLKRHVKAWALVNKHLLQILKKEGFENLHNITYPMKDIPAFCNRPRKLKIAYAGLIAEHKGIFRLERTIKELRRKNDQIEFSIIGEGNLLHYLKNEFKDYLHINFHGNISIELLFEELASCSVVYLPSKWQENFNLIGRYSRIVGTPILLPKAGGYLQRLKRGMSEYYNPFKSNEDSKQLLRMMNQIINLGKGSIIDREEEILQCDMLLFLNNTKKMYSSIEKYS